MYNIQYAIQKLSTKFHVSKAIEPRVFTVDTQIALGHLNIFAIYLHIKPVSRKVLNARPFFGTLHGDVFQ